MSNEQFFIKRLAELRRQKGVSARDMSLSLGQNENYINHIEHGKMFPSMQAFFGVCEYLGITPRDFFDAESEHPAKLAALTASLKKLDETALDHIIGIVDKMK